MTFNELPPEVQEELAAVRKAVESLRAAAANHRAPEALEPSHAAVRAVAAAHDQAMNELATLGFTSLGNCGEPLKDGSTAVSRWFADADGTTCGWLAFLGTKKKGLHLVVFLMTEAPGPAYCTSLRGSSGLSLARPPHVSHADYEVSVRLAEMARTHRERASSRTAGGKRLTTVASLNDALALMERLHQARMTWRASCDQHELLRADLRSVLTSSYRDMAPADFRLIYGNAAQWLDFKPPSPSHAAGPGLRGSPLALGPLADFLTSTRTGDEADQDAAGAESGWLFHCEFELRGTRLQILDVYMAGNDDEGIILDASPGAYIVEARVIGGSDRRISRVRVYQKGQSGTRGELAGEVGVDLAAVAICDVDRLAGWAQEHENEWQRWGDELWYGRTSPAGVYACDPANTVVPFLDSGFGDGTYPVYYLMHAGRAVGLEAVFIAPATPNA